MNNSRHHWLTRRAKNIIEIYSWNIFERGLDNKVQVKDIAGVELLHITKVNQIEELESDKLRDAGFSFLRDKELILNGCTLFYAFVNGELAHVTHVFIGPNAHKLHPLTFAMEPSKKIVGLAAFTNPQFRRKGLHLYTRSKVFTFLTESGYKHVWDVQIRDNYAVKNSVIKIGYYLRGTGYRFKILTFLTIDIAFRMNYSFPFFKIYFKK